eukprot:4124815-Pyramimonas_sp.AAC.1
MGTHVQIPSPSSSPRPHVFLASDRLARTRRSCLARPSRLSLFPSASAEEFLCASRTYAEHAATSCRWFSYVPLRFVGRPVP